MVVQKGEKNAEQRLTNCADSDRSEPVSFQNVESAPTFLVSRTCMQWDIPSSKECLLEVGESGDPFVNREEERESTESEDTDGEEEKLPWYEELGVELGPYRIGTDCQSMPEGNGGREPK